MEFLTGKIFGFVLIQSRISAFMVATPLFNWKAVPIRSKIIVSLLLSIFFAAITPCRLTVEQLKFIEVVLLFANEFLYGLATGFVAYCIFTVVRVGGHIIEQQMGLTMANTIDPFTGEQGKPLGTLLEVIFVLLLFATESHHLLVQVLGRSFAAFHPGIVPEASILVESVIKSTSALLMLALQMSAPILAAFLLLMVILAFMARVAPEANILFLSMPLRVGAGIIMVGVFIPFLSNFIKTFVTWTSRLMPI
jgi:flagellar biosynthetic protein FliR